MLAARQPSTAYLDDILGTRVLGWAALYILVHLVNVEVGDALRVGENGSHRAGHAHLKERGAAQGSGEGGAMQPPVTRQAHSQASETNLLDQLPGWGRG